MTLPRISVVTVSYNQGEFIRQNIESVLAQNYPDFEHIVVDGGSNDGTVEILKAYPHLKWTSKPDKGQADALNQGFERAGGRIIAWLNSDDWYAPGAFHEAAAALESYPVVMGCCELADRAGKSYELVENLPCTFHDILKYWVYYSIPAQPAIFFRRELLEQVRRGDGKFLDEDLEFGMDYEFWLRLARRHDFTRRISRTLAYARMYEENKTGKNMAAAYNEYGRIFQRHANLAGGTEHKLSFVIPVKDSLSGLDQTLQSIGRQSLPDYEVLLVEYGGSRGFFRAVRREVISFCGRSPLCLRVVQAEDPSLAGAMHAGGLKSGAPLAVFLTPGAVLPENFALEAVRAMGDNAVAVQIPLGGRRDLIGAVTLNVQGQEIFNQQALLGPAELPLQFIARKVALMELGGLRHLRDARHAVRELLLRLIFKGWQVRVSPALTIEGGAAPAEPAPEAELTRLKAELICDLDDDFRREPMAALRARHGFGVAFPAELVAEARRVLGR